jgi:hypothetical protein
LTIVRRSVLWSRSAEIYFPFAEKIRQTTVVSRSERAWCGKLKLMKAKLLAILLLIGAAEAQEKLVATERVPDAPSTRRFWSAENKIDLSIFAAQLAADAITTQRGLSEGFREVNPLMRPLVTRGVAGQATASALSFGAGLGTVYLLHATHHYRAERITLRLILAGEGALVGHNIALLR